MACAGLPGGDAKGQLFGHETGALTKADPTSAVERGDLREDLYDRLNVVRLRVPPLRERREDVPMLFARFLGRAADRMRRPLPVIGHAVRRRLLEHDWPGDLRDLSNFANEVVIGLASPASGGGPGDALADKGRPL